MTTQLLNISATTLFHFEWRDQSLLAFYVETAESDWQIKVIPVDDTPLPKRSRKPHIQNTYIYTNQYHMPINVMPYYVSSLPPLPPSPPPPSSLSLQRVRLARLRDRSGFDTSLLKQACAVYQKLPHSAITQRYQLIPNYRGTLLG